MKDVHYSALIEGLVGDRQDLYLRSAFFYNEINGLAHLLELFVNGMAEAAGENDASTAVALAELERHGWHNIRADRSIASEDIS